MKRGEIWTVAGGVYSSKPRPAVIVQDDRFGELDSVTVCPLTTTQVDARYLRMPLVATALSGLDDASSVMVDKLTTVQRSNVGVRVGALSTTELVELERLLLVFLGIAD